MKGFAAALLALLIAAGKGLEVPEPRIEVFHPKGLRVSIPDSPGVQSVQFLLSVKHEDGEAVELFDDSEKCEGGYWTYWNPDAVLGKGDVVYYKIMVEEEDMYRSKEGEKTVDEVYSLDDGSLVPGLKLAEPRVFDGGKNLNIFRHRNRGLITEGQKSSYHSSYSSYQSSDSKPITRSSTSSTTGSFVRKPDGEIEASGFKKTSNYDSTKREGEQWEVFESELSPEELEELKRFVGPGFRSVSELTAGQVEEFKRLHGSNFHIPERIRSSLPEKAQGTAAQAYEESYFSKESSSSVRSQPHVGYGRTPSFQQHHERASASRPVAVRVGSAHQPSYDPPEPSLSTSSHYKEQRYHEATATAARPVALSVTAAIDSSDYQQEVPAAFPPASGRQTSRNYDYTRTATHRVASGHASTRPASESAYLSTPSGGSTRQSQAGADETRGEGDDSDSGNLQLVEKPKYKAETRHEGSIFRSVTSFRAQDPQECAPWSERNYEHATDLREIQKSISKISCLASYAEHSLKEELRRIKQQNSDLSLRLESLDRDFQDYKSSCKCFS